MLSFDIAAMLPLFTEPSTIFSNCDFSSSLIRNVIVAVIIRFFLFINYLFTGIGT